MPRHDSPAITRRAVVHVAAWSAPTITALASAPAFATSGLRLLTISDAGSDKLVGAISLKCRVATTQQVPAGSLTVTVTATASGAAVEVFTSSMPPGWTVSQPGPTTLVFTFAMALATGQNAALTAQIGSTSFTADFTVLAQAPGFTSSSFAL